MQMEADYSTVKKTPVSVERTRVSDAENRDSNKNPQEMPLAAESAADSDIIAKINTFSLTRGFWYWLLNMCEGNSTYAAGIISFAQGVSHPEECIKSGFRCGNFKKPSEGKIQYAVNPWMERLLSLIRDYEFSHPGFGATSTRRKRAEN
jgi:hypothetical protein